MRVINLGRQINIDTDSTVRSVTLKSWPAQLTLALNKTQQNDATMWSRSYAVNDVSKFWRVNHKTNLQSGFNLKCISSEVYYEIELVYNLD